MDPSDADMDATNRADTQLVLDCLRRGKSNKEIAQTLNIAEPTVKNHVHHLLEKLDVTTRAQAAAHATLFSGRRQSLSIRPIG